MGISSFPYLGENLLGLEPKGKWWLFSELWRSVRCNGALFSATRNPCLTLASRYHTARGFGTVLPSGKGEGRHIPTLRYPPSGRVHHHHSLGQIFPGLPILIEVRVRI